MNEAKYRILFKGEIAPNADPDSVKRNLASLYQTDVTGVERFFSGTGFVLKSNVTMDYAQKYREQFEKKTGARCSIVKMPETNTAQPQPQKTPPAENQPSQSNQSDTFPAFETLFRVMFKGELVIGKNPDEVKNNLSLIYRVKPDRLEAFFTSRPVTVKEPTDFWTATGYLNRFKEAGAMCCLEIVDPPGMEKEPDKKPLQKPGPAEKLTPAPGEQIPVENPIKSLSDHLYEHLTRTYSQVRKDHKIDRKEKEYKRSEVNLGCLYLLALLSAVASVIFTPLRWYWGLIGGIGMLMVLSFFQKPWDTKYADSFLWKIESEKKKDFPLFVVTLEKWVKDLPAADRSRSYLQTLVQNLVQENPNQQAAYEQYSRIINPVEPSVPEPAPPVTVPAQPEKGESTVPVPAKPEIKPKPQEVPEEKVYCPRCGSTWVTSSIKTFSLSKGLAASVFLGPLAGSIFGRQFTPIYICESCGKKWKKR